VHTGRVLTPDRDRLLRSFVRLVEVDSPSRQEGELARLVRDELVSSGWHVRDDASGPSCGNLIATLPGNEELEPLLFSSHMDVVMPCLGVRAHVDEASEMITSADDTVLGADAKVGVAALLELARLLATQAPHTRPQVELVLTWGEEVGHLGAKALDVKGVQSRYGWVLDGLVPVGTIIVAAPTHYSFAARFIGRGAHAGVEPELGISAIAVAAAAISKVPWGRLDQSTTANVGLIRGGTVRNAVPAEVQLEGEVRSLSAEKAAEVLREIESSFEASAQDAGARLEMDAKQEYRGYDLSADDPVVLRAREAFEGLDAGRVGSLISSGGGSDANEFNARGLRTCVLGIGAEGCHTVSERVRVSEIELLTRWVLGIVDVATQ
jgi:tripeptide aminopeptidase